MGNIVKEATEFAKKEYAKHDPMHRWDHVEQVMDTAFYLEDFYREEIDAEVLRLAVIFHDIWYENYDDHVDESVRVAKQFLQERSYSETKTQKVLSAMLDHSGPHRRKHGDATSVEGKIVYDSDKFMLALNPVGYEKYFDQLYLPETKDLVQSKRKEIFC